MDREKTTRRIEAVIDKISKLLTDIPPEQLQIANDVVKRVAFMQVLIEDMEQDVIDHGPRRTVVRAYNIQIKSYNNTIKQLLDTLPDKKKEETDDELIKFLKRYS